MYNNPYIGTYNSQANIDRINEQISNLEKMRNQMQQPMPQPTNLTQNFQLAPTNKDTIRYANSIEEVHRDVVLGETPFFSKDMSVVWVKNTQNQIKTYELNEIIPKDEKDIQIELLQEQIRELKGMFKDEQYNSNDVATKDATNTKWNDETDGTTIKENKPTSIQNISTGKKRK